MHYRFGDYELNVQLYQLRHAGELVEIEPKVFDLLVYLLQHHDRVVSKDELLDKLWPDQVVSETALTQAVMAARKAVGDDGARQHTIKTQHGRGYRFVAALVAPVQSSRFQVPGSEEGARSQEEENHKAKVEETEQATEIERKARPRQVRLIVLVSVLGSAVLVAGILAVRFFSVLSPSPELRVPSTQPALPLPDKPSIIVLPFVNLSGDPAQEYFSDGVTEEITAALSRLSSLFVIARTSAFIYKGKATKVQDISKEMGVRYVLEGSARKGDGQIRIIAQLIDATTGEHLWSEKYDRPLTDIFAVQDEIVQKIVQAMKLNISVTEQGWQVRKGTDNVEAYEYFLRALDNCCRYTKEANAKARQFVEKAVEIDPAYAEAYAVLGVTYFFEAANQWSQDPLTLQRALELEQKALALDETVSRAHWTLGYIYPRLKQHDKAITSAERAIALDPNFADGYVGLAAIYTSVGRAAEAVTFIEKAMRLNPRYLVAYYTYELGRAYYSLRRYQEAIAALKEARAHNPNQLFIHFFLAAAYSEFGQNEEARAAAAELLKRNPAFSLERAKQGGSYKDPVERERIIAALRKAGLK